MESTKLFSTSTSNLQWKPFFPATTCSPRSIVNAFNKGSSTNERDYGGSLVDENMIVLRARIREMKTLDACINPPSHWMEWEKKYFEHFRYNSDVLEGVGLLQNFLLNIRPSLALGLVALVSMSLPISTGVVLFRVIEMAKMILYGIHLG